MNQKLKKIRQSFSIVFLAFSLLGLFSSCNSSKNQASIEGNIQGLPSGVEGLAVITSQKDLSALAAVPIKNGKFSYAQARLGESYNIKLEIPGYYSESTLTSQAGGKLTIPVKSIQVDEDTYYYRWNEDQSVSGLEYSSAINEPVNVEVLGKERTLIDNGASEKLHREYGITLSNDELPWSSEHSQRLFDTMMKLPVANLKLTSIWVLTNDAVNNDIEIDGNTVRITEAAFSYANPLIVKANGRKGRFFSKRLHHALVYFLVNREETDDEKRKMADKILEARFGVTVIIPESQYPQLTRPTGNEHHSRFQNFNARELLIIINQFEEMPEGIHRLKELKYLLRRVNGQKHPLYPNAAAVAWTTSEYIEFMESAFVPGNLEHTQRLVIHEKAHFLWENNFSDSIKSEWIKLGGWYSVQEGEKEVWYTTKTTEFVSAYSHSENPNEDMAESISYFVINPDGLRSRSPAKYAFIRDYVMGGDFYVSKIRDDLTFQVYNLFPDYVYPGKIDTVEITVEGKPAEDKKVTVVLNLNRETGSAFEKASSARSRIASDIGTFIDVRFSPVDRSESSSYTLKTEFTLSKHARKGYWAPKQIVITDATGNERFQGINTFGWKLYLNNGLEDVTAPQYEANSMMLNLGPAADCRTFARELRTEQCVPGENIRILEATWKVVETVGLPERNPCLAAFVRELDGNRVNTNYYSHQIFGNYTAFSTVTPEGANGKCTVNLPITSYFPHGNLTVYRVTMRDLALNEGSTDFNYDSEHEHPHEPKNINFTSRPDSTPPVLLADEGQIGLNARPTNPEEPNGETVVTIDYTIYDPPSAGGQTGSGYNSLRVDFRDPQGKRHVYYDAEHPNYFTIFFKGNPSEQRRYTMEITLPVGSAPGLWGITKMVVFDKAGNVFERDFTEIVRFNFSVSDN